jgi:hypothetical protein
MKKLLLACFLIPSQSLMAQINPFALYENPANNQYYVAELDPLTATITTLDPIIGMTATVVPDKTVIDLNNNYYIFSSLTNFVLTLNTWSISTGSMVSSVPFSDNVVGLEYNCENGLIYGLYEFNNAYELVTLDPVSGNHTTISAITAPLVAYVGNTFTLDPHNNWFSFIGHDGADLRLYSFDLTTGAVVNSNVWNGNVVGQVFNVADSTVYGLIETTFPNYDLVTVDPVLGTYSSVGTLAGVTAGHLGDAAANSQNGTYVFRGFDAGNNLAVFTVDMQTASVTSSVPMTDNIIGFELKACHISTTGIEESAASMNASVFPNPFAESATLSFSNPEGELFTLSVYSVTGAIVETKTTTDNSFTLAKGTLESGIYFYELTSKNNTATNGKFVIR